MHLIRTFTGAGWLHTREAGSAQAKYRLDFFRGKDSPPESKCIARGVLTSEGWALAIARMDGAVRLLLQTGEHVDIRITSMGVSDTTATFIVTGEVPAF